MSKTLGTIAANVRTYLDEATQDDWKDVEVYRAVNASYMEVYTNIVEVYDNYYSVKATAASIANQQEYTLPSDFFKIVRVELNTDPSSSDSTPKKCIPVDINDVMHDLGNTNSAVTIATNPSYYIRGNILGFIPYPTKSGATAITIWYIKIISELSAATDTIDIPYPDRYFRIIAKGAAAELLRKGQQEEDVAAQYLKEYRFEMEKMKQELEDRIADNIKTTVDTQGQETDFEQFL